MARPRVVLDDDAWAAVRVAYEDTDEAVHRIGFRFGISRVRIYDQAAKDGWRMRSERTVRCAADVPPPRPQPLPVSVLALQSEAEEATSNFDQSSSPMPSEASQHIDWTGQTHEQRLERLFRIIDQLLDAGHSAIADDETAWCAAFAGAMLERSGHRSTRSLRARSYLVWGDALEAPRTGCVAVLSRGSNVALGHVGFVVGETDNGLVLLGGNQRNAVTVQVFARSRLLGFRWPGDVSDDPPPLPQRFAMTTVSTLR